MVEVKNAIKKYKSIDANGNSLDIFAVNNVSFRLEKNCGYGLVGESGSGKSTLSRLLIAIEKPDSGSINIQDKMLSELKGKQLREYRRYFQIVMQDAKSSLNPKHTVLKSIIEPLDNFNLYKSSERKALAMNWLKKVGLDSDMQNRYPSQLSQGQLQRVSIARALICKPKFVVFDEAVSGLDSTVKKKILDLIKELSQNNEFTYLFITHDINVALYLTNDIYVMYKGKIVEHNQNAKQPNSFKHGYSKSLIRYLPSLQMCGAASI